jgi:hypothetical protein
MPPSARKLGPVKIECSYNTLVPFCVECGKQNPEHGKFCHNCGRPLFTATDTATHLAQQEASILQWQNALARYRYPAVVCQDEPVALAGMVLSERAWLRAHVPRRRSPLATGGRRRDAHGGVQGPGVRSRLRPLSRGNWLGGGTVGVSGRWSNWKRDVDE